MTRGRRDEHPAGPEPLIPVAPERKKVRGATANHRAYLRAMRRALVTIVTGPAGTGKTWMACGLAAEMLLAGQIDRVVLTRPLMPCGEDPGYLPGTEEEKLEPYVLPMLEALEEFLSAKEVREHRQRGVVEVRSLAFMRGRTLKRSFVIADEMENSGYAQLKMLLTRLGPDTKMVLAGDVTQSDINHGKRLNPLERVVENLQDVEEVESVRLTENDIMRPEVVRKIVARL